MHLFSFLLYKMEFFFFKKWFKINWIIESSMHHIPFPLPYIQIFLLLSMLFAFSSLVGDTQYHRSCSQQIKILCLRPTTAFVIFLIKFYIVSHCLNNFTIQLNNLFFLCILFLSFYNFNNIFNQYISCPIFFPYTTNFFENSKIIYKTNNPWNFCSLNCYKLLVTIAMQHRWYFSFPPYI